MRGLLGLGGFVFFCVWLWSMLQLPDIYVCHVVHVLCVLHLWLCCFPC